jgi:hypothetical protein
MQNTEGFEKMSYIPLRIHIIPIGKDTDDRMIIPLKKLRPDRIYLFTVSFKDAFAKTVDITRNRIITELGIPKEEIILNQVDYYNTTEFLQEIAKICRKEQEQRNEVYINISGGTMISVVGSLASIYFGIRPYFAQYDYSNQKILEDPFFPVIPHYDVILPQKNKIQLLTAISIYAKLTPTKAVSKGRCIDLLKLFEPNSDVSGKTPNDYNKLNARYIEDFLDNNFIVEDPNTRGQILMTDHGIFTVNVFSAYHALEIDRMEKIIKNLV